MFAPGFASQNAFYKSFVNLSIAQMEACAELTIQNIKVSTNLMKQTLGATTSKSSTSGVPSVFPTQLNYIPNLFKSNQGFETPFSHAFDIFKFYQKPSWPTSPFQAMMPMPQYMPNTFNMFPFGKTFPYSFPTAFSQFPSSQQGMNLRGMMMFFDIPLDGMNQNSPMVKFIEMFQLKD